MDNLKKILEKAEKKKVAVGHFNIADLAGLKAIVEAAKESQVPVIIGTSEGEAKFLDRKAIVAYVKALREKYKLPIFLNSDHTHSFEEVKKAVDAGYDAILFDGAHLPFEENIRQTKKVVRYVKSKNLKTLVEGELGNIGSGSMIRKELPKGAVIKPKDLTTPEQAVKFVKTTGVDLLAPAVGNFHGMLARRSPKGEGGFAGGYDYPLDIERIRAIKKALRQDQGKSVPLVLHGGSGNTDSDFIKAIDAGINIIHISTEIRVAWRKGLEYGLKENPDEIAPYKLLAYSLAEVKKKTTERLKLFNKIK